MAFLLKQVTDAERAELGKSIVVKVCELDKRTLRFVTHLDVSEKHVELAIQKFAYVSREYKPWRGVVTFMRKYLFILTPNQFFNEKRTKINCRLQKSSNTILWQILELGLQIERETIKTYTRAQIIHILASLVDIRPTVEWIAPSAEYKCCNTKRLGLAQLSFDP